MIQKEELELCKRDIQMCVGRKARLKTNGGRKRTVIREGVIEKCYPKVFTVRCLKETEDGIKPGYEIVTYDYIDILTGTVEVAVEPETAEKLEHSYDLLQDAIDKEVAKRNAERAKKREEAEE